MTIRAALLVVQHLASDLTHRSAAGTARNRRSFRARARGPPEVHSLRARHSRAAASPPASLPALAVPRRVRLGQAPRRTGRIDPLDARLLPERTSGGRGAPLSNARGLAPARCRFRSTQVLPRSTGRSAEPPAAPSARERMRLPFCLRDAALATVLALTLSSPPAWAADLRVLASFLPMYLFARNVGGDAPGVTVEMMLPASLGCPHDYSLSPGDMRKIAESDVFIANGFGIEVFLGAPVRRANPKILVVETASSVAPLRARGPHGGVNPHTWISPRNAIVQVRAIEKALSDLSPENAPVDRKSVV